MSVLIRRLAGLAALLVAFVAAQAAQAAPQPDRCVVLVSIDGLANFYLDDPKADMPTIRRLAREGARARGMICTFPTVTWPSHTTMATGVTPARHGVIGNSYLDRRTGKAVTLLCDPVYDKDQVVKWPTIYDVARAAGLKTAAICWPATRNARTLDWTVPDMFGDAWQRWGTKSWLAELRVAGLPVDSQGPWCTQPTGGAERDWLYTRMAAQVLRKHLPNLLLVHLVEMDHVEHRSGPRSPDAYWCASYSDDRVRDLVEAIEHSPLAGKTTLMVCSDHGFFPVRNNIQPNVVLRKLGLIVMSGSQIGKKSAYCLSQGGACMVYVLDDARREEITEQLARELAAVEGVETVLGPERFAKLGQPTRDQDPRAADLWLAAKRDYAFADSPVGDKVVTRLTSLVGTHGYLPDQPDMLATCVVWGAGIKPGVDLGKIRETEIAPMIARLLGLELPAAKSQH
jgi:predicted AlkP superfamily pyrophosphatase or phosphodiesterase